MDIILSILNGFVKNILTKPAFFYRIFGFNWLFVRWKKMV